MLIRYELDEEHYAILLELMARWNLSQDETIARCIDIAYKAYLEGRLTPESFQKDEPGDTHAAP